MVAKIDGGLGQFELTDHFQDKERQVVGGVSPILGHAPDGDILQIGGAADLFVVDGQDVLRLAQLHPQTPKQLGCVLPGDPTLTDISLVQRERVLIEPS